MRRICVVLSVLAFAMPAAAQQRDPVKADTLFREGQRLLAAGDVTAACPMLADSYALDPALGTLLNLAFCHDKQGRTFTALGEFKRAAAEATRTEQKERASFARTRIREIEAKLPRARIEIASGARVTSLKIDGAAVEGPIEDTLTVPAGTHTLDIETSTGERFTQSTTFPADPSGVTLVRFGSKPREDRPQPVQPVAPVEEDSGRRTLGWGLAGAGVIALGAGGYFGIATFSKKSDADAACGGDGCTAQGKHDGDLAHTYATASTVLIGAGIVAVAAGLYLVLTAPSARTTALAF
jgi:hypothetical protein